MQIQKQNFEISFFWIRAHPPITVEEHEDYEKFSKVYQRLNDVFVEMPSIPDSFGYAKEFIFNPNSCESWQKVLNDRLIPYKLLEWRKIYTKDKKTYWCDSKSFVNSEKERWIIRIRVRSENEHVFPEY